MITLGIEWAFELFSNRPSRPRSGRGQAPAYAVVTRVVSSTPKPFILPKSTPSAIMPAHPGEYTALRRSLLAWYAKHARSLPWRGTNDPYKIWVSEIMLQQTTTQTVVGYFDRFVMRFPSVQDLAAAKLDEVQRHWEGLGYYRRCTQMHEAAQEIVAKFGGVFPDSMWAIRSLPGIGRYTAGAIASIAFDRREAILEANTLRLHARLTGLRADPTQRDANETLWDFAQQILPAKHPGKFNQALMDLGRMICLPKKPRCKDCPVTKFCDAFRQNLQDSIPHRKAKAENIARTEIALLVQRRKRILVIRYPDGERWAKLWDFPRSEMTVENFADIAQDAKLLESLSLMTGRKLSVGPRLATLKHSVTKYRITLHFCEGHDHGRVNQANTSHDAALSDRPYETRWVTAEEMRLLPLHSTARRLAESVSDTGTQAKLGQSE